MCFKSGIILKIGAYIKTDFYNVTLKIDLGGTLRFSKGLNLVKNGFVFWNRIVNNGAFYFKPNTRVRLTSS